MNPRSRVFYFYIAFVVLYVALNIINAPSSAELKLFHITVTEAWGLITTVILLMVFTWFAAFYGFAKLNHYAHLIKRNKDGRNVQLVALGVTFLGLWLPVSSVISDLTALWVRHHPGFLTASTIIHSYIGLALPLTGFIFISIGAQGLTDHIRQRPSRFIGVFTALFLAIIAVIYCYFTFTNNHLWLIFHLPNWLLISTIIVPYVFMWVIGVRAIVEIFVYSRKAPGVIYRQSWNLLSIGLALVILASIGVQYLTTLTAKLSHLRLSALLVIVYCLLVIVAAGYLLIALGAKKLQRIEEV